MLCLNLIFLFLFFHLISVKLKFIFKACNEYLIYLFTKQKQNNTDNMKQKPKCK